MKKSIVISIISFFVLFLSANVTFADKLYIAVTISEKKVSWGNGTTDVGASWDYGYYDGNRSYETIRETSRKRAEKKHSADSYDIVSNENQGEFLGNHMVIIVTSVLYDKGVSNIYGVGFGEDDSQALENAKKNLADECGDWSEEKHGYHLVKSARLG